MQELYVFHFLDSVLRLIAFKISQSHLPGFEGFRLGTPDGHNTREIVTKHLSSFPGMVVASDLM